MKKLIFLVVLLVAGTANSQIIFQKTFGGILADKGYSVEQTFDGGYIIAGVTESFGAGGSDFILIKTDQFGNQQWSKTYGGSANEDGRNIDVIQTADSGYAVTGYTYSFGAVAMDLYVIKTDQQGNTQWDYRYDGQTGGVAEYGRAIVEVAEGGYIIAGTINVWGFGSADGLFLRLDANGNFLWEKVYGAGSNEHFMDILQLPSGDFIASGSTQTYGPGVTAAYLVKTDSNGNILWDYTYGGSQREYYYAIERTTDGGYILAGASDTYGAGNRDVLLAKVDSMGTYQWSKTYGGSSDDQGLCIKVVPGSGYIILGYTESVGAGSRDILAIRTDSVGNVIWSKTFGSAGYESTAMHASSGIQITNDGGFVFTGWSDNIGNGGEDIVLIKTDSMGSNICNDVVLTVTSPNLSVNNPSSGSTIGGVYISVSSQVANSATIDSTYCLCGGLNLTKDIDICIGDSILLEGAYQTNTGTYYDTTFVGGGCDSIVTTNLSVVSVITNNVNSAICEGDSTLLEGAYQTTVGTYYDTTITTGGCDSVVITTLGISQPIAITLNSAICEGESIFAGGAYQTLAGTYYDSLLTINGCDSIITTNLSVLTSPLANAETDTTIKRGESVQLYGSGGLSYSWSPPDWLGCTDCPNPIASPQITTTYCVTVTDTNGCAAEDCVTIIVEELICDHPFVPNVFSPNGDGNNDIVYVRGNNFIIEKFIIYDRWGEKVFETEDVLIGWDGQFRGKMMNPAVYVWYLEVLCAGKEEPDVYKGNITLVR